MIEYRQAHPVPGATTRYSDESSGAFITPRARSFVTIAESSEQFGGVWFSNKKSAQQYAAKKAIDWLVANAKMPADGTVSFPKGPVVAVQQNVDVDMDDTAPAAAGESYASLVPDLAHKLGFNVPRYEIVAQTPGVPLYNAWAEFGDARIQGRVGENRNVHGKKNARDHVAKEVYTFLKDIERQRLAAAVDVKVDSTITQQDTTYTEQSNSLSNSATTDIMTSDEAEDDEYEAYVNKRKCSSEGLLSARKLSLPLRSRIISI